MPKVAIVIWIANVLADTAGRVAFKAAALNGGTGSHTHRWIRILRAPVLWCGIVSFCLEFLLWLALLSLIPLSQAILIGSVNIVTVAITGRLVFGEELLPMRVAGMILIAAGVVLAGGLT